MRRIARELRPEALDDLGLVNALIALCYADRRAGRADASSESSRAQLPPLSAEAELVLYRIAQESLTNALRHADASSATVSLEADAKSVTLRVTDDGEGHAGASCRAARRGSPACASGRCLWAGGSDRLRAGAGHRGAAHDPGRRQAEA